MAVLEGVDGEEEDVAVGRGDGPPSSGSLKAVSGSPQTPRAWAAMMRLAAAGSCVMASLSSLHGLLASGLARKTP